MKNSQRTRLKVSIYTRKNNLDKNQHTDKMDKISQNWIKRTKMDIVDKIGQYEEIEQILDENMNRRTQ